MTPRTSLRLAPRKWVLVLAIAASPAFAPQSGVPVGAPPQGAASRQQVTLPGAVLISLDTLDDASDGASQRPDLDSSGRHVAFESLATDLVAGDTNAASDIFVRDRDPDGNGLFDEAGALTVRVSVATGGVQADLGSERARISADGRQVAFESDATNLVLGDINALRDVFVHDRDPDGNGVFDEGNGTTVLVSRHTNGTQANAPATLGDLSADGRFVAFSSTATSLEAGDLNGLSDVFMHDRDPDGNGIFDEGGATTRRVSLDSAEVEANGASAQPALSADGRFVVFESEASNLAVLDTNGVSDVFVRDRDPDGNGLFDEASATTRRLSVASGGAHANGASRAPALSADGRFVVFESEASNFAADFNGVSDVFVHDRDPDLNGVYDQGNGLTWRLSASDYDGDGNGPSRAPAISADGRYVSFESRATNLVQENPRGIYWQVFVVDRDLDGDGLMDKPGRSDLWRVSLDCISAPNGDSEGAGLSGDGLQVSFGSQDSGLVAGDSNGLGDVFARPVHAAAGATPWYRDVDGDGFGVSEDVRLGCDAPAGYVAAAGDCDDSTAAYGPGAVDPPDDLFADTNCDGIDGDASAAVFVAPLGSDSAPGTRTEPMATVSAALVVAAGSNKDVYVAAGTFTETSTLVLEDGVSIYGGYDPLDWSRSDTNTTRLEVAEATAVSATGLTSSTVLERLEVVGANAATPGGSAYGLFATTSAALVVRRCELSAGAGSAGGAGFTPGGTGTPGGAGSLGQPGCEDDGFPCSNSCGQPSGGNGGSSPVGRPGGKGGNSGKGSQTGFSGAAGIGPGAGAGGAGTPPGQGGWAPPLQYQGAAGAVGAQGASGAAGAPGYLSAGYAPSDAGGGAAGEAGNGGGGGGGGGGGNSGCDSYGGGGGGGGGGGAGGLGAGGGQSAGGSFAVYLWACDLTLEACQLRTAGGGPGGASGLAQPGGIGGTGANTNGAGNPYGGSEQDDGSNGGRGGNGGAGGAGGPGGGGAGGPSIGVYRGGGSSPTLTSLTFDLGAPGAGGASAGNPGPNGEQQDVL
jgi:Tol biopolymer transport system component